MEMQSMPQMFFARAASRGQRPAQLVKQGSTWQAISWQAMSDSVRHIAQGWLTLGLQVGDRVALLASSRAEWVQCDLGIMAAAGITVPQSDVDAQIAKIKAQFPSDEDFSKQLAQVGQTPEQLTETIRKMLQQQRWLESQLAGKTEVTEEEAKKF